MPDKLKYILLLLICITAQIAVAQQYNPNNPNRMILTTLNYNKTRVAATGAIQQ